MKFPLPRRLVPILFLLGFSASTAQAQLWTTYAYPNNLNDLTRVGSQLWMATTGGALRYDLDAHTFQQYTRRAAGGPLSQTLNSVAYDPVSAHLFFGSSDLGVSEYDPAGDRWSRFEFLPSNEIQGVSALQGEVQMATASGFAIRRSANRTDICNEIDRGCCGPDPNQCDFPSFDVRDWAATDGVHLWSATGAGPAEFDGARWRSRSAGAPTDSRTIEAFDGQVFVASSGVRSVFVWNPAAGEWGDASNGLRNGAQLGDKVRLVATGGGLFLACQYGLFRWSGTAWESQGLDDHEIHSVVSVDRIDIDLAVAGRSGLWLRHLVGPTTQWSNEIAPGPPLDITGQAVAAGKDGTLWIGTLGGVESLAPDGTTWTTFHNGTAGGLSSSDIFSILADSQSRLWVGKCCCHSIPNCPTQFVRADDTVSPVLSAYDGWGMDEDSAGRLWIGSNSTGAAVLAPDGSLIAQIPPASGGLISPSVRAVGVNGNDIWLGHEERGLQIARTGGNPANVAGYQWKTFSTSTIPDPAVAAIENKGRDTWVLTASTLILLTDEVRVRQWPLSFDGEPRRGTGLAIDRNGNRWVGTTIGVLMINTAGETSLLSTANSDLISDDIVDVDLDPKNGDILFATRIGVSRLKPGAKPPDGNDAALYLYPNPFHSDGTARVKIGGGSGTEAQVFDMTGRAIARFTPAAGWDGTTDTGETAAPGIYLVVVDGSAPMRLALLR